MIRSTPNLFADEYNNETSFFQQEKWEMYGWYGMNNPSQLT